jgi:hypothetical protein
MAAVVVGFSILIGASVWDLSTPVSSQETRTIDLSRFRLEVAETDEARRQGLSGHEPLAQEEGMLFLFAEDGVYPFWMKDMTFAIDIIWLDDGRVVDVATLPAPASGELLPATHVPSGKADTVLEINAGRAKALGIEKGVMVVLP